MAFTTIFEHFEWSCSIVFGNHSLCSKIVGWLYFEESAKNVLSGSLKMLSYLLLKARNINLCFSIDRSRFFPSVPSIIVARFVNIWNVRAVSWPVGMLLYPSTTRRCQSAQIAWKTAVTCLFMCVLPCNDRFKIWCTVSKVISAKFRAWP